MIDGLEGCLTVRYQVLRVSVSYPHFSSRAARVILNGFLSFFPEEISGTIGFTPKCIPKGRWKVLQVLFNFMCSWQTRSKCIVLKGGVVVVDPLFLADILHSLYCIVDRLHSCALPTSQKSATSLLVL